MDRESKKAKKTSDDDEKDNKGNVDKNKASQTDPGKSKERSGSPNADFKSQTLECFIRPDQTETNESGNIRRIRIECFAKGSTQPLTDEEFQHMFPVGILPILDNINRRMQQQQQQQPQPTNATKAHRDENLSDEACDRDCDSCTDEFKSVPIAGASAQDSNKGESSSYVSDAQIMGLDLHHSSSDSDQVLHRHNYQAAAARNQQNQPSTRAAHGDKTPDIQVEIIRPQSNASRRPPPPAKRGDEHGYGYETALGRDNPSDSPRSGTGGDDQDCGYWCRILIPFLLLNVYFLQKLGKQWWSPAYIYYVFRK